MPFTPDEDLRYRALLATLQHLWKDLKLTTKGQGTHQWGPRPAAYLEVEAKIRDVGRRMSAMLAVVAARDAPRKKE